MTTVSLILLLSLAVVFGLGYLWDHWAKHRWSQLFIDRILRDIRSGKTAAPRDYHVEITFDAAGFSLAPLKKKSEKPISIQWDRIVRVIAFKRDLFSTDLLCLLFVLDDDSCLEVHEEMKHWQNLIEALPIYLESCKQWSNWFMSVVSPAFAKNETEIFLRGHGHKT